MAATTPESDNLNFDPRALAEAVTNVAGQSNALMQAYLSHQARGFDPLGLNRAFLDLTASLMKNPHRILEAHFNAWNSYIDLWLSMANRALGRESEPIATPGASDRRFRNDVWRENPFFDYLKQSYLVAANTIQSIVADAEGLDEQTARKVEFYTKQYVDALSPTNFLLTNPEVMQRTVDTNGQNLLQGLQHFVEDFDPESGRLRIRMTDHDAFELGRNVAVSPGKVIYQNELMQLIQYAPATEQVFKRPLLIIPPWINKYYILDLQPKNSLIKWLVEQGHTVFVISWVNPDESLRDKDFEDYVFQGPLDALDAIEAATGEKEVNVIGYCIGGTLLSATLAYLNTRDRAPFVSATFFVTLIDFTDPGDLGVFVDEDQLTVLEQEMHDKGYHDGREMALTFNLLRSNDLIWSFYINNYLMGKEPFPFDLLYWNSDSTRMPAKMHSTYLRRMYLENSFRDPGAFTVDGVPIDVRSITTPSYFISTQDDHIAPWKSTYLGAQLFTGPVRFVLGESGHIAGIVNPPAANKYGFYTNDDLSETPDEWLRDAQEHAGSWWPDWQAWVRPFAGELVPARVPGEGRLMPIEDAPGSYVKVRS
jgi:polyhydroxyalkanoate synthase